ncbi:arylsulfatase [Maribellus maritimus]|uniref:arylsulfatase n=1 Tax=Maribellus maritimus TaxID=2870838 RepID=UPI001EE9EF84|nr:arylsulfatase [Maribellus maritimus]MCG6187637.1 arylsulfatase [Maribellus maritimus]
MKLKYSAYLLFVTVFLFYSCITQKKKENSKPNIIYILADDLGYGDLSCYGQKLFSTPNIDKMASEGMLFTQHYAGATVCAPSRSSLMTGQTTGHTPVRGNKAAKPEGQWPIPDSTFTIAEMLKKEGYVTGAFGKWGLGYPGSKGDPNMQGFDEFYGYNCQRKAHNYYPAYLWHNQNKVILNENNGDKLIKYAPELIHHEALQFIEQNRNKPFFMYYPNIIPHAELLPPETLIKKFRGKFLPEKSFDGTEPDEKGFRDGSYGTQPEGHAAFAAMVTLLDKQVGDIFTKLKELGIDDNTLVIFSSDNGPHLEAGADPDYFDSNGPLRGYKRDLYEGGIREPMIAWYPGKIKAGTTSDHVSAFWDVMPTIAELVEIETPKNIDGISFLPTLLGQKEQQQHDFLYWEFHERGGTQAVRKGDWKAVLFVENGQFELYNLSNDKEERNNVAKDFPEVVGELKRLMREARISSKTFPFLSEEILNEDK